MPLSALSDANLVTEHVVATAAECLERVDIRRFIATRRPVLSVSVSGSRYGRGMPPQRTYGGRKSKGDRQPLLSRVPSPIADAVRDCAEERGMTLSDYIASVLARDVGLSELVPQASIHHDEELPINKVA